VFLLYHNYPLDCAVVALGEKAAVAEGRNSAQAATDYLFQMR
jgi:hypothetical protein